METKKQSKLATFMEERFVPAAARIGGQRHLLALRDGIVMVMPLVILAAFALIVLEFPIDSWVEFLEAHNWVGDGSKEDILIDATFGIIALVAAFGVANSLASSYKKKNGEPIDGIPAGILSIATFFIINHVGRLSPLAGAGRGIGRGNQNRQGDQYRRRFKAAACAADGQKGMRPLRRKLPCRYLCRR